MWILEKLHAWQLECQRNFIMVFMHKLLVYRQVLNVLNIFIF